MKTLVFMMMLTMAAVSASVVYLAVNRDPLGGMPHVDVALEAPPPEEAKAEPAPEATTDAASIEAPAAEAAAPDAASADDLPASPTGAANATTGSGADLSIDPSAEGGTGAEPVTTTAFPIPAADPAADVPADAAATGTGEPAAVDQ